MTLRGARILLAGACTRTGRPLVEAFLALGAQVVAADRLRTELEELRAQLRQHERLWVAEADSSGPSAASALFADVARDEPIDAAVLIVASDRPADGAQPRSRALPGTEPRRQCEAFLEAALEPIARHGRGRVLVLLEPSADRSDAAITAELRELVQRHADRVRASGSAPCVAAMTAGGPHGALLERVVALCDPALATPDGWQTAP